MKPFTSYVWKEWRDQRTSLLFVWNGLPLPFGLRHRGRAARAAWIGALTACLCLTPAWAWSAWRLHVASTFSPDKPDFRILDAYLGVDGRHIFLNADDEKRWTGRSTASMGLRDGLSARGVVVDLATKRWRMLADEPALVWPVRFDWDSVPGLRSPRLRLAVAMPLSPDARPWAFDGACERVELPEIPSPAPSCPNARDLGLADDLRAWRWCGLGVVLSRPAASSSPSGWFDPLRCQVFEGAELFGDGWDRVDVSIRPGAWLVSRPNQAHRELFDPLTRISTPLLDLPRQELLGPVLDDGRYLLADRGGVVVYSPEDGTRTALAMRGPAVDVFAITEAGPVRFPLGAYDPPIVHLMGRRGECLARLDIRRGALVCAPTLRRARLVACEDRRTVIVIDDERRLVRQHFGSVEQELLFPVEGD